MSQYKKSVDMDGNITSLFFQEIGRIVIFQPVAATNGQGYEVNITQVSSNDELKAYIGGAVYDCAPEDWNETLFVKWGFSGSNIYAQERKENAEIPATPPYAVNGHVHDADQAQTDGLGGGSIVVSSEETSGPGSEAQEVDSPIEQVIPSAGDDASQSGLDGVASDGEDRNDGPTSAGPAEQE